MLKKNHLLKNILDLNFIYLHNYSVLLLSLKKFIFKGEGMMNGKKIGLIVLIFIVALSCISAKNTLVIGFVDPEPVKTIEKHQIITDYIKEELNLDKVTIKVTPNISGMVTAIKNNEVDIFIDTIFSVLTIQKAVKLDIILRRWKKGVDKYHTVFIAKSDSPISDLKNLKGKKIAFEDATSTSGKWIPQAMLMKMGYKFVELENPDKSVPKSKMGYAYTYSEQTTAVWVMQNKVDLGVISNNDYDDLPAGLKSKLKIIGKSFEVPRQLITCRANFDNTLKQKVISLFLKMHTTDKGKDVLAQWEKTAKMDAIDKSVNESIKNSKSILKYVEVE